MTYTEKKYKQKISLGQSNSALMTLVAIHLVLFIIFAFVNVLWSFRYDNPQVAAANFSRNVLNLFILPANMQQLVKQPWCILTFMFVQTGVWQVLANMLWLWCFGFIMQDLTGNRKIIPVFIYGSLAGGLAFVLTCNLLPSLQYQLPFAYTMGASAGVMAVAIATTIIAPQYRIFPMLAGGIPLWILTALYVVIDVTTLSGKDPAHLAAHICAAGAAVLFMFFLRKGYDGSDWMNNVFEWVDNLFNPERPRKGKNVKQELFYRSASAPYTKTSHITQQRVDDILDKINQKGYSFLTDEEKELLKRASEEDI